MKLVSKLQKSTSHGVHIQQVFGILTANGYSCKEEDSKIPVIDKEEEKPQEEVKKVNNKYILIGLFSIVIVLGYILYDTFYTKKEKEIKEENITNNEEVNDKEENEVNKTDDEE